MTAAKVVEVIDGDTIKATVNGKVESIRLVGVDAPETHASNKPVMCYGAEATAFTQSMVDRANGNLLLEKDVSERDQYGRLLRYVWLPQRDGKRMLNEEMVKSGYAEVVSFPPDLKYHELFLEEQRQAVDESKGLWGACGSFGVPLSTSNPASTPTSAHNSQPAPTPTSAPTPTPTQAARPSPTPTTRPAPTSTPTPVPVAPTQPPSASNCDPAYPGVCIAPPPPDLDCKDITYRRFKVLPPDPHNFDSDHDGIGCESR